MTSTRSRSLAAVAAGALLVTALAGCGSDDKAKDTSSKPSASATTASPSAEASTGASTGAAADGTPAAPGARLTKDNLVATMVAAMREKKTAHMTMELGSSIGADADIRYSGSETDMKMSMDMGPTKAEIILVDGTMYMQQSAGGKYLKIDKSDPAMGTLLDQMSAMGPESSISAMNGAVEKVEYAGRKSIDGDTTDLYHVTVDTAAAAKGLGGIAGSAGNLPASVTYDLYVDHDHLMRRVVMTVSKQTITMTVSKWGEPVDIEAPPASEVMTR
jgi:hypothetical protein